MTLENYKNVLNGVNDRFMEIGLLLVKLKNGENIDFPHLLSLIKQSHTNEINLFTALVDEKLSDDVDVPEFMK